MENAPLQNYEQQTPQGETTEKQISIWRKAFNKLGLFGAGAAVATGAIVGGQALEVIPTPNAEKTAVEDVQNEHIISSVAEDQTGNVPLITPEISPEGGALTPATPPAPAELPPVATYTPPEQNIIVPIESRVELNSPLASNVDDLSVSEKYGSNPSTSPVDSMPGFNSSNETLANPPSAPEFGPSTKTENEFGVPSSRGE